MHPHDYIHNLKNGITGMIASGTGLGLSMVQHVEQWMRISSLLIGIIVGLVTLYNITLGKRKGK